MGRLFKLMWLITLTALLLAGTGVGIAQDRAITGSSKSRLNRQVDMDESELRRTRTNVILKIKETRANAERLLDLHEKDRQSSLEEYERRRKLYDQGLIARTEAFQAEQAMAKADFRVQEDRRRLAEIDMAITEVVAGDELHHLPALAVGGYGETAALLRFNGGMVSARRAEA